MKKRFFAVLVALAILAPTAFAGDITPTGISQGDLYDLLNKLATNFNKIKAAEDGTTAADNVVKALDNIVLSPRSGF